MIRPNLLKLFRTYVPLEEPEDIETIDGSAQFLRYFKKAPKDSTEAKLFCSLKNTKNSLLAKEEFFERLRMLLHVRLLIWCDLEDNPDIDFGEPLTKEEWYYIKESPCCIYEDYSPRSIFFK